MIEPELLAGLRSAGLIASSAPRVTPLNGGVSSDILLVEDHSRRFVVKRALAKLKVRDDWYADIGRNRVEQDFLAYAARAVPESVPGLLYADRNAGWFAMEYCGEGWRNWKSELTAGRFEAATARLAGETLGRLHFASWNEPAVRERFDTLVNFRALRIEPYLVTTADRVAAVRGELLAEADRLAVTRLALVHGDYSPKNLLVAPNRLLVLDAEVAWFGDPAFDVAFLVNHLLLKALLRAERPQPCLALVAEAWTAYSAAVGAHAGAELERRVVRLALCLMLARVHGKSPVEYLTTDEQRRCVTDFVAHHLPAPPSNLDVLVQAWSERVGSHRPR
ncbi:MAG TPA: phosphotransferase [Opitutaceae bacterium]|nr:phosphotransferase [Opitutaceae bacterium]